jgi:nucleotide-binding universal stress UspA family protein
VLVARRASITSILVAVDGSSSSKRALAAAVELSERLSILLSVVLVAEMIWEAPPEAQRAETANERKEYESLLAEMTPFPAVRERIVSFGEPAEALLTAANRTGADLIAMGRTGQTPHPRVSLGSTASRIVSNAEASVLLVP